LTKGSVLVRRQKVIPIRLSFILPSSEKIRIFRIVTTYLSNLVSAQLNKMAKRNIDDTELSNEKVLTPKDGPAKKKSRKDKTENTLDAEITESIPDGTVEESKEARKERRKQKKAKRAAEEHKLEKEEKAETSADDAKAAKAARKAEKVKLKLAKQSPEDEARESLDAPVNTISKHLSTDSTLVSNTYIESTELAALPEAAIKSFLADNFISITDPLSASQPLRPITKFSYLPSTDAAQQAPFKSFKSPTPIQAAAWPFLLAGRDVIGVAETGSGKTMAFAVPCVRYITSITKKNAFKGAKAVVVSPTRELAMQSYEQITKLANPAGLQVVCVYGGVPKYEQRKALETADIVVATPGRLNDLINEGSADLSKVGYVVLDEADRMLDKGFEEEIRKIINTTQPLGKRQTLMFTATWPESVRTLAATFMTTPIKIAIGDNPSGDLRANTRITQKVEVVDPRGKEYRLLQLLKQYQSGSQKDDRIIVFCLYKKEATRVEAFIRSKGLRVAGIHGDLSQEQRTRSLDAFKKGTTPILVATDVAARGLDIPSVELVLNLTYPLTTEDYVHRIGRTGRAGKEGLAITLFTEHDKALSGRWVTPKPPTKQSLTTNWQFDQCPQGGKPACT
jgi:ATP-dependent RNA helicase DBP3